MREILVHTQHIIIATLKLYQQKLGVRVIMEHCVSTVKHQNVLSHLHKNLSDSDEMWHIPE